MKTVVLFCILLMFGSGLLALSGYGTSAPVFNDTVDPTLSIIAPNGGEAWYIGDTNDILWNAMDTNLIHNSVYLWYSLNGGTDYISLAEAIANSGSYAWEMPSVQSDNARVRIKVSDSFGNFAQGVSAGPFSIIYVPPAEPEGVTVDISNNVDAVITWQAVTQTIPPYNTPITPDGYIVLYNETPYEDNQFYYFLAMTTGLSHTHPLVARFRDQMFYKVLAFKDYRGNLARLCAQLGPDSAVKYTWGDILHALAKEGGAQ